jgi:enterochelin esterase family protein
MENPQQGLLIDWLTHQEPAGGEAWWQAVREQGAPLSRRLISGDYEVLFLWRDPQGSERTSSIRTVYMDVNSVTDHHSLDPATMERWAGTDIWFWTARVPAHWRGAYQFIPCTRQQMPDWDLASGDRERLRNWWISLQPQAVGDPLNPLRAQMSQWGVRQSALHMPEAPPQPGWLAFDQGVDVWPAQVQQCDWRSERLGNQRQIWLYTTAGQASRAMTDVSLVLLLDGRFWAQNMPIFSALESETRCGRLPPALYVLIDEIDGATRGQELPCNPEFWHAVMAELFPLIATYHPVTANPARTIVAGQSYGGLAALYAGLHWPERFGAVLSQSGSFWWPDFNLVRQLPDPIHGRLPGAGGWLTDYARRHPMSLPLKVWLEAGTREGEMISLSETMCEALLHGIHDVSFRSFEGGHDRLCWRGGLIDGLSWLLSP